MSGLANNQKYLHQIGLVQTSHTQIIIIRQPNKRRQFDTQENWTKDISFNFKLFHNSNT